MMNGRFRTRFLFSWLLMVAVAVGGLAPAVRSWAQTPEQFKQAFNAGSAAMERRDYQAALQSWGAALDAAQRVGAAYEIATFSDAVGSVYSAMGQHDRAVTLLQRAVAVRRQLDDPKGLARTYNNLGVAYQKMGQRERSLETFRQALGAWEEVGEPEPLAFGLMAVGEAYLDMDKIQTSQQYFQRALRIREQLNNPTGVAECLSGLGVIHSRLGQLERALECYQRSLAIKDPAKDPDGTASTLSNIGSTYRKLGDFALAEAAYERSLRIQEGRRNLPASASTLSNIAILLMETHRYDAALTALRTAQDRAQQVRNKPVEATVFSNLAYLHALLGQHRTSLEYEARALATNAEMKDVDGQIRALVRIGKLSLHLGEPEAALALVAAVNRLIPPGGSLPISILDVQAEAYLLQEKTDRALELAKRGQSAREKMGIPDALADGHLLLGKVYLARKEWPAAAASFAQAIEIKKRSASRPELAECYALLGSAQLASGQLVPAESAFSTAMGHAEAISREIRDAGKLGDFQQASLGRLYADYAVLLAKRGKPELALEMAERGRSQGMARQMGRNRADTAAGLPPADARKLKEAVAEFNAAAGMWRTASELDSVTDRAEMELIRPQVLALRTRHNQAEQQLTQVRAELAARYPAFARRLSTNPPKLEELSALPRQNPDTLYLEWAVGSQSSVVFTYSNKEGVKALSIPVGAEVVKHQVAAWRRELLNDEGKVETEEAASVRLYATLFTEVDKLRLLDPERFKRLVLVGDGALLDVPLGALMDPEGRRVVERLPVSTSVSLGSLTWADDRPMAVATLFCAADPLGAGGKALNSETLGGVAPLPAAREEGKRISALFPGGRLLVGEAATRTAVMKDLGRFSILHFATHGHLDSGDGLRSGLALAPDADSEEELELLEAREISGQRLAAQLAVLSACETGEGQLGGGEGLLGLVWAFRAAGCPSVVASQWSVEDQSTGDLMQQFYQGLKANKRKDEALREAMLEVRKTRPHPYFWAAFQLSGDSAPLKLP